MANGKAKRYTTEEKQEILDFISSQGRGGQSAAVKKYGVTAATISNWKKKLKGGAPTKAAKPAKATRKAGVGKTGRKAASNGTDSEKALATLNKVHGELAAARSRVAELEAEFEAAKAAL